VARRQGVVGLGQRAEERQSDAQRVECSQLARSHDDEHHASHRQRERSPAHAVEPLAEPDHAGECDEGGVHVEDQEGQGNANAQEGCERSEVQACVRGGCSDQDDPVADRQLSLRAMSLDVFRATPLARLDELPAGSFFRQPRSKVAKRELRVDRGPVIALGKRRDKRRRRSGHDADAERDRRVRLGGERTLDRLVDDRCRA